jgi:hypothetical protein
VTTVQVSQDSGRSWHPARRLATEAGDDEALVSVDPRDSATAYVVSHLAATYFTTITVARTADAGRTFTTSVVNAVPRQARHDVSDFFTRVLVDPRDSRRLYLFWIASTAAEQAACSSPQGWHLMSTVFVARSDDAGATCRMRQVADLDPHPACPPPPAEAHPFVHELANEFPDAAVDAAGTLYLVCAEGYPGPLGRQASHVMLMRSEDGARTFTTVQVDGGGLRAAFAPAVVTAGSGHVDVAWYGTDAPDETSPAATWAVMLAQSVDARDAAPSFTQTAVAAGVHRGGLCSVGVPCTDDAHHETVGLTLDGRGGAVLMWLQDSASRVVPTLATQIGGPRI